ncbi:Cation/H+ exchanger [Cantharellus anzutake]|uniref:Cation/H+ exchanger n=1 Tax=Cantharellus anzutake TaxID=1750568 RepID=UPI0019089C25|nr:Cation/H+ exchanger [Cantharellus anzutake]KAF8327891.1 Cation/H+ exchanger [Cantharellus anzutake]
MWFNPTDVNPTHLAYTCIGGFVVIFSMFSNLAKEKLYIGEVIPATLFGIIVGPSGASIFTPRSWGNVSGKAANDITLEVTRVVLACGVFAIGAELPRGYMIRHWKSLVYTVVPVMAWGWFISAGLIVALFPELTYQSALVISACLTPTDPILAAAVVGGRYSEKNVPSHLRHLLAAESAANDGLAYPFLWLPLYLTLDKTTGEAVRDFICIAILYQVVLGVAIGMALGFIFSVLTKFLEKWKYVGRDSYVIQFLSLALFTIGAVTLMGNDDLLAAFAAGCTVSWDGHFHEQTEETIVFAHILELLLNCAVFVFVGGWIRFPSMNMPEFHITPGRLSAFFFLTLFVRRIPPMLLLYKTIPDIHTWKEALFAGWFGPMGIGAVFISTLALEHLPVPEGHPTTQAELISVVMHPIIAFTILGSIFIRGCLDIALVHARDLKPYCQMVYRSPLSR